MDENFKAGMKNMSMIKKALSDLSAEKVTYTTSSGMQHYEIKQTCISLET
jgi:hypothetical protein